MPEQNQIYIESAYAEFDRALRRALDQAMDRGVKVLIVTISMFMSDGASKFVRVLMSHWTYEMQMKHVKLFQIGYAGSADGHMIHFKGAALARVLNQTLYTYNPQTQERVSRLQFFKV